MPTTPIYALPYPAATDPADVPLDMQELAERVEAVVPPKGTAAGQVAIWDGTKWIAQGGQLAYAELTTSKSVTATSEAAADTVVAAPATVFDGTAVVIEFWAAAILMPNAAGATLNFWLYQDGSSIARFGAIVNPAAAQLVVPVSLRRRLTPSAASHTYVIGASQTGGTAQVLASGGGPGAYLPAFIRITRA